LTSEWTNQLEEECSGKARETGSDVRRSDEKTTQSRRSRRRSRRKRKERQCHLKT
jgi:hypothetical protein